MKKYAIWLRMKVVMVYRLKSMVNMENSMMGAIGYSVAIPGDDAEVVNLIGI